MQQVVAVWSGLDARRRLVVALAAAAVAATLLWMVRLGAEAPMALLYAGLEPRAAGEVLRALEQRGVPHEVRGDAVYVPADQRDSLRLGLAAEGLPATGGAGYEILDGLSGFGTTAQMFDAAYLRAREGELARTIASGPGIRSARVHIAQVAGAPFRREVRPTAAVTVLPAQGPLPVAQARAIRHLVAAAVPGLAPEDVTVIDGATGLAVAAEEDAPAGDGRDRAEALRNNIERLLEARVGRGRAIAEVSVETVTETESLFERRVEPDRRVASSAETEERTESSADAGTGGVSVASNLPGGDAAAGTGGSRSQMSETRERLTFEVSESRREVLRAPGAIRRITVAVLVDGVRSPDGSSVLPRPEEELAALRELVASAVGFDAARGDVITLQSLPFELPPEAGTLVEAAEAAAIDPMRLAQLGVLAAVALALGLFVLRPILAPGRPAAPAAPAGLPAPPRALPSAAAGGQAAVLEPEIEEGAPRVLPSAPAELAAARARAAAEPPVEADPVARLRRLIAERQAETVEILRSWMEEREEKA